MAIPPDWVANHQPRKFGLAPTPLRLCKTPVGVPSGTATVGRTPRNHPRLQAATFASAHLRPPLAATLPIPGGNATENRTHGNCSTAGRSLRSRGSSGGHCHSPSESPTTRCTRRCRQATTYLRHDSLYLRCRGSPGPGPLGTRKLGFSLQNPLAPASFQKRSLTARLGKSFPINSSFIGVISS